MCGSITWWRREGRGEALSIAFEQAIAAYVEDRSAENLDRLDQALIKGEFLVPVSHDAVALEGIAFDIPAVCYRRADGAGVLPAFTSVDNHLSWKADGTKYVELGGRALIEMVRGMVEIQEVAVNPDGVPRGPVPRIEFDRLLAL